MYRKIRRWWLEARKNLLLRKKIRLQKAYESVQRFDESYRHQPGWVRQEFIAEYSDIECRIYRINKKIVEIDQKLSSLN